MRGKVTRGRKRKHLLSDLMKREYVALKRRTATIRWTALRCTHNLTSSQLNLPHRTKQKRSNEETKNN